MPPPPPPPYDDRLEAQTLTAEEVAHFRMVMPAPTADIDLCKTLISGSVLGYPVPTLIAWNQSFNQSKGELGSISAAGNSLLTCVFLQTANSSMAAVIWPRSRALWSGSSRCPCRRTTTSSWSWTHTVRKTSRYNLRDWADL